MEGSPTPAAARYAQGPTVPLVSIVLVSRDHAQYVREALASVAAQTYQNIELIVIVDGSKTALPQIIEAALADFGRNMRVAFVKNDDTAPDAPLNRALDLAEGDFVQFLASDDAYLPTMTACSVDALLDAGADVAAVCCDGYVVDDRSRRRALFSNQIPVPLGRNMHRELLLANWLPAPGMLYRRAALTALGGFDPDLDAPDWDLHLRLTREHRIARIPDKLFLARLGSGTLTRAGAMTGETAQALADRHPDVAASQRLQRDLRQTPLRALIRHRTELDLVVRIVNRKVFSGRGIQGETFAGAVRSLLSLSRRRLAQRLRAVRYRLRGIRLGRRCKLARRLDVTGHRANLDIGAGVIFEGDAAFILPRGNGQGRVAIGDGCVIAPGAVFHCLAGDLVLGPSSYVGRNVVLQSNGDLRIGAWTLIAANAGIYASNHVTSDPEAPVWTQGNSFCGITIGENCWIAHGAVVTDGSVLGDRSVVGPNMVVRGAHAPGSRLISQVR